MCPPLSGRRLALMSQDSVTTVATGPVAMPAGRRRPALVPLSLAVAGCGLLYALYRAYYGFGGTVGLIGTMRSATEWRVINFTAAGVLLVAAALPIAALPLWRRPGARRVLLVLAWVVAVGCVMHALIQDTQRVLSLTGVRQVGYPASLWATLDRHAADVQDLAFNETWFFAEGVLWGLLGWIALDRSPVRRRWVASVAVAVVALSAIGILSSFGVIGRFVLG
jgi:hypothetical protein